MLCSMRVLSSLTRDRTHDPCIGSSASYPLDAWDVPQFEILIVKGSLVNPNDLIIPTTIDIQNSLSSLFNLSCTEERESLSLKGQWSLKKIIFGLKFRKSLKSIMKATPKWTWFSLTTLWSTWPVCTASFEWAEATPCWSESGALGSSLWPGWLPSQLATRWA